MTVLRASRTAALLTLLLGGVSAAPSPAGAQSVGELLRALSRGGGWVQIPVVDGEGGVDSGPVPTGGLELDGCVRIWSGHSGSWDVRAEDTVTGRVLERSVVPGEPVRFSHATRSRARLRVDVRWSEPRDTTLLVWVGVQRAGREGGAACEPRR